MGISFDSSPVIFNLCIVLLALTFPFCAVAQDDELLLLNEDTIVLENKKSFDKELAGYLALSLEMGPAPAGVNVSQSIGGGVFYEGFNLGLFMMTNNGEIEDDPFTPRDYNLPFRLIGGYFGKSLYRGQSLQVYSTANMSFGKITWRDQETQIDIFDDNFMVLEPEIQLSYLPFRFLQVFSSIGYRKTIDLDLTQVQASDLEGFTLNFGIRVGYFYKPKKE